MITTKLKNELNNFLKLRLIKDFDFIAESSYQDPENFIGNPVNALLLIKKLTKDLQKIVDTMNTYSRLKGKLLYVGFIYSYFFVFLKIISNPKLFTL